MHLIKFKDVQLNLSLCKIQVGTVMHGLNFYNNRKIKNQHFNQANKQTLFSGTSTNEADLFQYKAFLRRCGQTRYHNSTNTFTEL